MMLRDIRVRDNRAGGARRKLGEETAGLRDETLADDNVVAPPGSSTPISIRWSLCVSLAVPRVDTCASSARTTSSTTFSCDASREQTVTSACA